MCRSPVQPTSAFEQWKQLHIRGMVQFSSLSISIPIKLFDYQVCPLPLGLVIRCACFLKPSLRRNARRFFPKSQALRKTWGLDPTSSFSWRTTKVKIRLIVVRDLTAHVAGRSSLRFVVCDAQASATNHRERDILHATLLHCRSVLSFESQSLDRESSPVRPLRIHGNQYRARPTTAIRT